MVLEPLKKVNVFKPSNVGFISPKYLKSSDFGSLWDDRIEAWILTLFFETFIMISSVALKRIVNPLDVIILAYIFKKGGHILCYCACFSVYSAQPCTQYKWVTFGAGQWNGCLQPWFDLFCVASAQCVSRVIRVLESDGFWKWPWSPK